MLVWFGAQDYATHYVLSVALTGLSLSAGSRKIWIYVSCTYWSVTYPFFGLYQPFVEWYVSAVLEWYTAGCTLRVCGILSRHILPSYYVYIYFGIFPSIPRSSTRSLFPRFSHHNFICIHRFSMCAKCPRLRILFSLITVDEVHTNDISAVWTGLSEVNIELAKYQWHLVRILRW